MGFLSGMNISGSGLTAQRMRMDVIAENIANVDTTRGPDGNPYTRKYVVLEERNGSFAEVLKNSATGRTDGGVRVTEIGDDPAPFQLVYDPDHPDANEEGYVEMPNVDITQEMVDMISAYRSYEANVTAFNAYKDMAVKALEIGR
jgi:flagellar basal-body rod protein FlgC